MKFQEYLHNKENIDETQKFSETEKLNEFSGDEATKVDFGLFSVGGGGEIDAAAAAVGVAALVMAKGVYNYGVYKWLQGKLPSYLEQYKVTQAKSSTDLFDAIWERDKINPLKEKKMMLLGTGGERVDKDVEDAEGERGAKQQIKDKFRAILAKKGIPEEKKKELRQQRDQALSVVDKQIQALSDQISKLEEEKDIAFAQKQEEFRKLDEKFEKQQEKFIEVRDSIFASSWKKRWVVEFKDAKGQADIEVLEKSLELARESASKRELAAIQDKLKRSKESQAEAKAALDEVMEETAQADVEKASLEELGIIAYQDAEKAYYDSGGQLETVYKKWVSIGETFKEEDKEDSGGRDKKASLEKKIETAEAKIEKGEKAAEKARADKEFDKAVKIEKAVEKIKDDLKSYNEEIANLPESFSDEDYLRMSLHINEAGRMLDQLLEEEGEKEKVKGTWSVVRKFMTKVISEAPDNKKEELATEAVKDAKTLANFENDIYKKQNVMVGLIDKRKKDNAEAKDKDYDDEVIPLPEGSAEMGKMPKLKPNEIEEKLKKYEDFIQTMTKSFNADAEVEGEKPKEPEEAGAEDIEDLEIGSEEKDPEILKQAKILARAEANLKKFVNEFEPDEDDQETIEKVRALRAEIKKHRNKGETKDVDRKQQDIDRLMRSASSTLSGKFDKLQDAVEKEREKLEELKKKKGERSESKKAPKNDPEETQPASNQTPAAKQDPTDSQETTTEPRTDTEEDSPEVKTQKEKINKLSDEIEEYKKDLELLKNKKGKSKREEESLSILQSVIPNREKNLEKENEKLKEIKAQSSQKKEESQQTKIAPKYMKFEEFMAIKKNK